MGTRGLVGFKVDNQIKMQYQQFDSYPSGVGITTLSYAQIALDSRDGFADKARNLRAVNDSVPPTQDDIVALRRFTNLNVSNQSENDWYCLLRETQGSIGAILDSGYILSDNDEKGLPRFGYDSLFCEWAYLVDFDRNCVDVYKGFQSSPPVAGIYAGVQSEEPRGGYHPITRIDSIPFELIAVMSLADMGDWARRVEGESE